MQHSYMSIAGSRLMFALCGIVVIYVTLQSLYFMRRAWRHGIEMGVSKELMKKTMIQSALFSIVPSIPVLIIMVALMTALGNYFPWLRLSVIGSGSYEYVAATISARYYGLESFMDSGYTSAIFLSTMWAMSICIIYEPLLVVLGWKPLDRGMKKLAEKRPTFYNLLIDGIFIAMMSWFCAPYLINWVKDPARKLEPFALIGAGAAALIFNWLGKKTEKRIFTEFSFPGGMIIGMLCAYIGNLFA